MEIFICMLEDHGLFLHNRLCLTCRDYSAEHNFDIRWLCNFFAVLNSCFFVGKRHHVKMSIFRNTLERIQRLNRHIKNREQFSKSGLKFSRIYTGFPGARPIVFVSLDNFK